MVKHSWTKPSLATPGHASPASHGKTCLPELARLGLQRLNSCELYALQHGANISKPGRCANKEGDRSDPTMVICCHRCTHLSAIYKEPLSGAKTVLELEASACLNPVSATGKQVGR